MGKLTGRFFSLFFLLFLYYNQLMQTQKKHFNVNGILLVLLVLFSPGQANSQWKQPIALQPFGAIEPQLLQQVVNGIKKIFCKVEVDIQPAIPLPKYAYYKPRNRYRAEKLLNYLESYYVQQKKKKYVKIIGLTIKDISTTKGQYYDWGIFGLAYLNARPCVVSTFRLKRNAKSEKHFIERLIKVVIHELGHTFGASHCPVKGCVMEDARGTIKTVDAGGVEFCSRCKQKLYRVLCR
jgi:archaemetzincin